MSKPLIPAQRRERIQEYLAVHQIARSADLCAFLDISEATVRRDLEWLERRGILERTHGGAILSQRMAFEQEYQQRAQHHPDEKKSIGELAASLINPGDVVFINSGTTATQVLQHIPSDPSITVYTNNVNAALELGHPGYRYFLIGGEFHSRSNSLSGRFAIENLSLVYANKVILCVDGVSARHGCTVPTDPEAQIVRVMIQRTNGKVIIAADHSKWGVVSNFQVASIEEVDTFISDDGLTPSAIDSLAAYGVTCRLASTIIPTPA